MKTNTKYPIATMKVGDTFPVTGSKEQIAALIKIGRYKKKYPETSFSTKKDQDTGKIVVTRNK